MYLVYLGPVRDHTFPGCQRYVRFNFLKGGNGVSVVLNKTKVHTGLGQPAKSGPVPRRLTNGGAQSAKCLGVAPWYQIGVPN